MKHFLTLLVTMLLIVACGSPRPEIDIQRTFFGITTGDTITRQIIADSLHIPISKITLKKGEKPNELTYEIVNRDIVFADRTWNTILVYAYKNKFYQIVFYDCISEVECQRLNTGILQTMKEKYANAYHEQMEFDKNVKKAELLNSFPMYLDFEEDKLNAIVSGIEKNYQIHFWESKGVQATFQIAPIGAISTEKYANHWIVYTDNNIIEEQTENLYQNL